MDKLVERDNIIIAVQYGNVQALKLLTADYTPDNNTYLLRLAIVNDHIEMVNYLLDTYNPVLNYDGLCMIMQLGVCHSSLPIIDSLVRFKCDITDVGAMYYSVKHDRSIEFIQGLVDMKADVTNQSHSRSPLVAACLNPDIDPNIILYLLNTKASLEIFTGDGDNLSEHYNICDIAFRNCNTTFIKILLEYEHNICHGEDSLLEFAIRQFIETLKDPEADIYTCEIYRSETMRTNMFDYLIETRSDNILPDGRRGDNACVYRSIRYILATLINLEIDELLYEGWHYVNKSSEEIESKYLKYIDEQRSEIYMDESERIKQLYIIEQRKSYEYIDTAEHIIRSLLDCKIDINSSDHQLLDHGTLYISKMPCNLKTISSMIHMRQYIQKLLPPREDP
jgi:hypothetical protein